MLKSTIIPAETSAPTIFLITKTITKSKSRLRQGKTNTYSQKEDTGLNTMKYITVLLLHSIQKKTLFYTFFYGLTNKNQPPLLPLDRLMRKLPLGFWSKQQGRDSRHKRREGSPCSGSVSKPSVQKAQEFTKEFPTSTCLDKIQRSPSLLNPDPHGTAWKPFSPWISWLSGLFLDLLMHYAVLSCSGTPAKSFSPIKLSFLSHLSQAWGLLALLRQPLHALTVQSLTHNLLYSTSKLQKWK